MEVPSAVPPTSVQTAEFGAVVTAESAGSVAPNGAQRRVAGPWQILKGWIAICSVLDYTRSMSNCVIDDCPHPAWSGGLCQAHYGRRRNRSSRKPGTASNMGRPPLAADAPITPRERHG